MDNWTAGDIEKIFMQLDDKNLPFKGVAFSKLGEGLSLLGCGNFANVYEAEKRNKKSRLYAVKVLGFGEKRVDTEYVRKNVELQKDLRMGQKHIVTIYDFVEIRVWIEGRNTIVKSEVASPLDKEEPTGDFLTLQFILMEKLIPVIGRNEKKQLSLYPDRLELPDEKELINLGYDIGCALNTMHKKGVIHRDVKLENVFYSPVDGRYKLGDFGIAVMTHDGMASTVAFTKGYGAPEVTGTMEDRYDYTADIYSLGMIMYVILNRLKFPEAKSYHPNISRQYVKGYVPPMPSTGSTRLTDLIMKMISFDPDDRPQSMEEVLNDIDSISVDVSFKFQREHKATSVALAFSLALIGVGGWRLSTDYWFNEHLSLMWFIFMFLFSLKGILKLFRKKTWMINVGTFILGLYMAVSSGGGCGKIFLVFCFAFLGDVSTGIVGTSVILADLVKYFVEYRPEFNTDNSLIVGGSVLCIVLAVVFNVHYMYMDLRKRGFLGETFAGKLYWWLVAANFIGMILDCMVLDWCISLRGDSVLHLIPFADKLYAFKQLYGVDIKSVMIAGFVFTVFWILRAKYMPVLTGVWERTIKKFNA